jgi:hypothetical protein
LQHIKPGSRVSSFTNAMQCRSTFGDIAEAQCFQGIVDWMNGAGLSKRYPHGRMPSWFYWAYNPDSGGALLLLSHAVTHASVCQARPCSDWQ